MYETFEHTADLGLRVRAGTLDVLFADAARGLCSMLVDNVEAVRPQREVELTIEGTAKDYLLFDWLNELLYLFESEGMLFSEFEVTVNEPGLSARVRGEPADPGRHRMAHEVKAITYHQLRVEADGDGWLAELIVDI